MTRVKICGITRPEDAALAVELGAFAIGMVFWPGSPRAISAADAAAIVAEVPSHVWKVGVFVNQPADDVRRIAAEAGLDVVQLHGDERVSDYDGVAPRVLKAIAVRDETAHDLLDQVPRGTIVVLDAHDPVRRGGTGRTIDWSLAHDLARVRPSLLSGGLRPDNVREAIRQVNPYGIDISSGVEAAPGRKDPDRLRALFAAVDKP
jgi:phosphoribosylanthranilate isomerase